MFTQSTNDVAYKQLRELANAYNAYKEFDWSDCNCGGRGGLLIDDCVRSVDALKMIIDNIGRGLIAKNPYATTACILFDKLYKDGLKDGKYKDAIQSRFKEILPEESIRKLNQNELSMEDLLVGMTLQQECLRLAQYMPFKKNT